MKAFFSKNRNRAVVFLTAAALLTAGCSHTFKFMDADRTNRVFEDFYALEENSVECVFFGSSITQRGCITPVAYHDYGITAYPLATGTQPFVFTKYLMIEALKTQKPKLFVVELKGVNKRADWIGDVHIRRVVDNMKPSINRINAIREVLADVPNDENGVDMTGLSYYFPLIKYHSLWNPSKRIKNFTGVDYYAGYSPKEEYTFSIRKAKFKKYDENHTLAIDEPTENALNDLLDFCDGLEDTEVLFVIPPYPAGMDGMGKMNYAKRIVESRGYEVLNMITEEKREEAGMDDRFCYYDRSHMNYYGSMRYTEYIFSYIKDKYGMEDMRGKKGCEVWEKEYERLMSDLETRYSVKYTDMMSEINSIKAKD